MQSSDQSTQTDGSEDSPTVKIVDFLQASRITLDLDVSSRKRLFQHIAKITTDGLDDVEEDCVFKTIAERERLGSTGLGKGIAVPHGRIENLPEPVVSLIRLKHPIDYDAPDERPVWLVVGLLVPSEANDTHLQLLANLAAKFQEQQFIETLRVSESADQVVQLFAELA